MRSIQSRLFVKLLIIKKYNKIYNIKLYLKIIKKTKIRTHYNNYNIIFY